MSANRSAASGKRRAARVAALASTIVLSGTGAAHAAASTTRPPARGADRIRVSTRAFAPSLAFRRALGAMQGDHRIAANLKFGGTDEVNVGGNIDPSSGDATVRLAVNEAVSDTSSEFRVHKSVAFGSVPLELRSVVSADWYRVPYGSINSATPPPIGVLITFLVSSGASASSYVDEWKQTLDTTFGPSTRHLHGTAPIDKAIPVLSVVGTYAAEATFDAWLDASNELRRIVWTAKGAAPPKASKTGASGKAAAAAPLPKGPNLTLRVDFKRRNMALTVNEPKRVDELTNIRKVLDSVSAQQGATS